MPKSPDRKWPWNWARTHGGEISTVSFDEWISTGDAAGMLGTRRHRVENTIANGHLEAARSPSGELGTTRESVDREVV